MCFSDEMDLYKKRLKLLKLKPFIIVYSKKNRYYFILK